jgi:ABC-type sugar transport system ATPase subunit
LDEVETSALSATSAERTALVRMRGISKAYPGVQALRDVDLTLDAGEVLAVTGENGSGKSTLAKILYGYQPADAGEVEINGEPVIFSAPADALALGIVAISQDLTLAPTLSVAENIMMGHLPRRRGGVVDWSATRRQARAAMARLELDIDETKPVGALSVELQQQVEVVRAVSASSQVIVLDEATSSLSEAATEHLLDLIRRLAGEGVGIVMISHRLTELYAVANRAIVLRDGRLVDEAPLPETSEKQLVAAMVGRDVEDLYGRRQRSVGEPVLTVSGLCTDDGELAPVDFGVHRGEILGIAGLVGSGKSTLGLALAGGIPNAQGEVQVKEQRVDLSSPRSALASGIGYVTDDRKRHGLLATRSVQENLSLWWLDRLTRFGILDTREERRMAAEKMKEFHIRASHPGAPITTLSGGNQQKVLLARVFALGLDVLVLNEPTRGVDVGAKSEVYRFMQEAAENGVAVVMISSELPELLGVTDRVLALYQGAVNAEFATQRCDERQLAHAVLAPFESPSRPGTEKPKHV